MPDSEHVFNLKKHYQEVTQGIYENDLKHYNFRTIENFIIHFDKLKNENKTESYELLNNYLNLMSVTNPSEIRENTVELYDEFVYPIAYKFYIPLGFVPYARWAVLYGMLIVSLIVMFFLGLPFVCYPIILMVFILLHCRTLHKKRNNKVFGLRY